MDKGFSMLILSIDEMRVNAQIARFPDRFSLAGFPGKVFAISRGQITKKGIVLCLALREELIRKEGHVVHANGQSSKRDGRWTQHGRISPEDLRLLIEYA